MALKNKAIVITLINHRSVSDYAPAFDCHQTGLTNSDVKAKII